MAAARVVSHGEGDWEVDGELLTVPDEVPARDWVMARAHAFPPVQGA